MRRLFLASFTIIFGLFANVAAADIYLPLMSTTTGKEIAKAYRNDTASPTKARADSDKKSCLLDENEISNLTAARLSAIAKTDRGAAEVEVIKAITNCMAKKGWRIIMID